jgi:hypothetical protein
MGFALFHWGTEMKVTAIKPTFYAGHEYRTGEDLDVSERDGKALIAVGKVRKSQPRPSPQKPAPALQTRDVKAERGGDDHAVPRKGRYRRRDQRADDSGEA